MTSAAWTTIEAFLDYQVSDTTLRSRRDDWVAAGVFDDLMEHALSEYDRLIGLDLSHVAIDGSCQLAPGGTELTSAYAGSKGRQGFKWSCGVDAAGIGIGFVIDTGARNDYRLLGPTLDTITERRITSHIGTLHLDRGYGYKSPRFLISVNTCNQYLAPSPPVPIHNPRMSRWPSTITPMAVHGPRLRPETSNGSRAAGESGQSSGGHEAVRRR